MKVTRRQGLATVAAIVGAAVLQAPVLGRVRLLPGLLSKQHGTSGVARKGPSRNVQPAPNSVKRHA